MSKLIQFGNAKLNFPYFNLPATYEVCKRKCHGCYAAAEEHRWPSVAKARQKRYEAALQPDFVSKIKAELSAVKIQPSTFRVHASGEFFSQQYVDDWYRVASSFPAITFYAYTKRKRHFDFTQLMLLPNFILIDSLQFNKLNYSAIDKVPSNTFLCPHQRGVDIECGGTGANGCRYCMTKAAQISSVWFVQH